METKETNIEDFINMLRDNAVVEYPSPIIDESCTQAVEDFLNDYRADYEEPKGE